MLGFENSEDGESGRATSGSVSSSVQGVSHCIMLLQLLVKLLWLLRVSAANASELHLTSVLRMEQ
jgi:hypothetical protein